MLGHGLSPAVRRGLGEGASLSFRSYAVDTSLRCGTRRAGAGAKSDSSDAIPPPLEPWEEDPPSH